MNAFLIFHVAISLVGIATGFVVLYGLLSSRRLKIWTAIFLLTTVLTSVTGFFLPAKHFMPSHALGIISLVFLPIATFALYAKHLRGVWRVIYVVTAMIAQYLNVFVLIVQSFMKVPALHSLAPNQTEPPFAITQLVVLALFVVLTIVAALKFRPNR